MKSMKVVTIIGRLFALLALAGMLASNAVAEGAGPQPNPSGPSKVATATR